MYLILLQSISWYGCINSECKLWTFKLSNIFPYKLCYNKHLYTCTLSHFTHPLRVNFLEAELLCQMEYIFHWNPHCQPALQNAAAIYTSYTMHECSHNQTTKDIIHQMMTLLMRLIIFSNA